MADISYERRMVEIQIGRRLETRKEEKQNSEGQRTARGF